MRAPANEPNTGVLRVAILGSGPSGSTLATILARRGAEVTLFDLGRRPELLVGESLVSAVIPMLRRLGIEEQIANFRGRFGWQRPLSYMSWASSSRRAADLAGVSRVSFLQVLARYGVPIFELTQEELEEDLRSA